MAINREAAKTARDAKKRRLSMLDQAGASPSRLDDGAGTARHRRSLAVAAPTQRRRTQSQAPTAAAATATRVTVSESFTRTSCQRLGGCQRAGGGRRIGVSGGAPGGRGGAPPR